MILGGAANGATYGFDVENGSIVLPTGSPFTTDDLLPTLTPIGGPDGAVFSLPANATAVYYPTGILHTQVNEAYTIRLLDQRGLSSQATTWSMGEKLPSPSIIDKSDIPLSWGSPISTDQMEGSNYTRITLLPPDQMQDETPLSGVSVVWELRRGGGLVSSGSGVGPALIDIEPGWYQLRAFSRKAGYVDSDMETIDIQVRRITFWVNADSGDDGTGDGSPSSPFRSIQRAVGLFQADINIPYTVYVRGIVNGGPTDGYGMVDISFFCALRIVGEAPGAGIRANDGPGINIYSPAANIRIEDLIIENGVYTGGIYFHPQIGDLTIQDCDITNSTSSTSGGGVYFHPMNSGNLSMSGCDIMDCSAAGASSLGGGAYIAAAGSVTIEDCTFSDNDAVGSGGAVYVIGTASPSFSNCRFYGNYAGTGGALAAQLSDPSRIIRMDRCAFGGPGDGEPNTASAEGGAICVNQATALMDNCTVSYNTANGYDNGNRATGGGISVLGGVLDATTCVISYNTANDSTTMTPGCGGGIALTNCDPSIMRNCTISGNRARTDSSGTVGTAYIDGHGGGIYAIVSPLTLESCAISGNSGTNVPDTAGQGGGVYLEGATLTLRSGTSITGNYAGTADSVIGSQHGAGIYAGGSPATRVIMESGSSITANRCATGFSSSMGGGAFVTLGAVFEMNGGEISGNSAATGAGMIVGGNLGTVNSSFLMRGNAFVNDNNEVFLRRGYNYVMIPVTIAGPLSGQPIVARIRLEFWIPDAYVLAETASGLINAYYSRFTLVPDAAGYYINANGRLGHN